MKFIKFLLPVLIAIVLLFPFPALGDEQDLKSIARNFLNLVKEDAYGKAADLFHYPKTYTADQKKTEHKSIQDSLKRYKKNLGDIETILVLPGLPDVKYIGLGVSGADSNYWQKVEAETPQIILPCRMEKIDFAAIRFLFYEFEDKWEIRQVDYSFIESEETKILLQKMKK